MSPEQLHTIFHVDSVEKVPNYEVVELTHHTPSTHHLRKRHIDSGNALEGPNQLPHHVKKDLSKTPFYSVPKTSLGKNSSDSARNSVNEIPGVVNLSDVKEHKVSFEAFGEKVKLQLKPTEGLFKDGPQNLRMWAVKSDPNATQGLNYEEITQVRPVFVHFMLRVCHWRPTIKIKDMLCFYSCTFLEFMVTSIFQQTNSVSQRKLVQGYHGVTFVSLKKNLCSVFFSILNYLPLFAAKWHLNAIAQLDNKLHFNKDWCSCTNMTKYLNALNALPWMIGKRRPATYS